MKLALERLGFGPCHHMEEVYRHEDQASHWQSLVAGEAAEWGGIFKQYRSSIDWPSAAYWHKLADHYPGAKILLTIRSPESWYNSISKTIFPLLDEGYKNPPLDYSGEVMQMAHKLIIENTFGGIINNKDHAIEIYKTHNARVMETAPKDRLLVYNLGDGWEPLCKGLGVPVPRTPFPQKNTRQEFWNGV